MIMHDSFLGWLLSSFPGCNARFHRKMPPGCLKVEFHRRENLIAYTTLRFWEVMPITRNIADVNFLQTGWYIRRFSGRWVGDDTMVIVYKSPGTGILQCRFISWPCFKSGSTLFLPLRSRPRSATLCAFFLWLSVRATAILLLLLQEWIQNQNSA